MRLADLEPKWVGAGGEGVTGADGSPVPSREGVGQGTSFETLTLRPSILRRKWKDTSGKEHGCGWHGFVTAGEVQTV